MVDCWAERNALAEGYVQRTDYRFNSNGYKAFDVSQLKAELTQEGYIAQLKRMMERHMPWQLRHGNELRELPQFATSYIKTAVLR